MAARALPHKRKIEEAFAGVIIDAQAADPEMLPGLTVVCGHTGRSPDDPNAGTADAVEPELPYLAVSCGKMQADPDMPPECFIKLADLVFNLKTQANDEARAAADARLMELEYYLLANEADILAAINIPADPATADTRRVQGLHVYAFNGDDQADSHTDGEWVDQISYVVNTQGFDPDRE